GGGRPAGVEGRATAADTPAHHDEAGLRRPPLVVRRDRAECRDAGGDLVRLRLCEHRHGGAPAGDVAKICIHGEVVYNTRQLMSSDLFVTGRGSANSM